MSGRSRRGQGQLCRGGGSAEGQASLARSSGTAFAQACTSVAASPWHGLSLRHQNWVGYSRCEGWVGGAAQRRKCASTRWLVSPRHMPQTFLTPCTLCHARSTVSCRSTFVSTTRTSSSRARTRRTRSTSTSTTLQVGSGAQPEAQGAGQMGLWVNVVKEARKGESV